MSDAVERLATHGTADLSNGVRLHYVEAGAGPRIVVLLHDYPQTWWQWRHVVPALVQAGFGRFLQLVKSLG